MRQTLLSFRTSNIRNPLLHLGGWLLYIVYELAIVYYTTQSFVLSGPLLLYYLYNAGLFYLIAALIGPVFRDSGTRYFRAIVALLAGLAVYLVVKFITDYFVSPSQGDPVAQLRYAGKFIVINFLRGIYFAGLSLLYWSVVHVARFRRQAAEIEKRELLARMNQAEAERQLAETQNAYLRQQVNPHLLFNSLNFVYNSVHRVSREGADCLLLLSDILRFSLEESGNDGRIPLFLELEQLENLRRLNAYRFGNRLNLDFRSSGDFQNARIIPLILLTLGENMYKHGELLDPASPALIQVDVQAGKLHFHTRNRVRSRTDAPRSRPAIGLQNIRTRLQSAYGDDYELTYAESGTFFELTLTIPV